MFFYEKGYCMKFVDKVLLLGIFFNSFNLLTNQDGQASNKWKIVFFDEYMKGYEGLDEPNHKTISQVLKKSFEKSESLIPEQDAELAAGVRDQVKFFIGLQDPDIIDREVKKCKDGMKEAHSVWAKMASQGTKARKFVSRFYKEYAKRKKTDQKND